MHPEMWVTTQLLPYVFTTLIINMGTLGTLIKIGFRVVNFWEYFFLK